MDDVASPALPAVALAVLAGILRGLRVGLPPAVLALVDAFGLGFATVGAGMTALRVGGTLVSPIGTFLAGYLWGTRTDVRSAYRRFSLAVYAAALAGLVIVTVALSAFLPSGSGPATSPGSLVRVAVTLAGGAIALVGVALAALAGGAVACCLGRG